MHHLHNKPLQVYPLTGITVFRTVSMNDFEFFTSASGYEFFCMAIRRNKTLLNCLKNHGLLLDFEAFSSTDITPEDYISNSTTLHQVTPIPACSHSPKFYMRCIPIAKPSLGDCWGLTSPVILPQWHQLGWPPWPRW